MSSVPKQSIRVSPERLSLSVADDRKVIVQLTAGASNQRVPQPDLDILMLLSPDEARRLADALFRTADRADSEGN